MAEPLRHRQTKEAATDMFSLQPPRHIPTLPDLLGMYRRKVGKFGFRKLDCIEQRVEIGDRVGAEVGRKRKSVDPEAGLEGVVACASIENIEAEAALDRRSGCPANIGLSWARHHDCQRRRRRASIPV